MPMPPEESRRKFYARAVYGLMTLIGAALAAPAAIYLLVPPKTRKKADWVDAGDLSRIAVNTPEEVVFRRNRVDGWKVVSEKSTAWVVKKSDNQAIAFAPQCTHLGCAYHWDEGSKTFQCPCHTSAFSIDGKVLSGPAPRPLDRYATKIENGSLMLGPIERSGAA